MRCIAILELRHPAYDTIILWDDGERMVAFVYQEGRVKMTRPLAGGSLEDNVAEVKGSFQITNDQVASFSSWSQAVDRTAVALAQGTQWAVPPPVAPIPSVAAQNAPAGPGVIEP